MTPETVRSQSVKVRLAHAKFITEVGALLDMDTEIKIGMYVGDAYRPIGRHTYLSIEKTERL